VRLFINKSGGNFITVRITKKRGSETLQKDEKRERIKMGRVTASRGSKGGKILRYPNLKSINPIISRGFSGERPEGKDLLDLKEGEKRR